MKNANVCLKFIKSILIVLSVCFATNLPGQITQVGTATTASSVDGAPTELVIPKPVGISVGDIMIANLSQATDWQSTPIVPAGTPTSNNWKQIATKNLGFDNVARGTILYRIADATDADHASYSFNLGANHKAAGAIVAFRGINKDNPFIAQDIGLMQVTALSNSVSCPGITTSANNAMVIMFAMDWAVMCDIRNFNSWTTAINPNPLLENYDYNSTSSPLVHVGAAWAIMENAGPTGVGTLSNINCADYTTRYTTAILMALRPERSVSITGPTSICAGNGTTLLPTSGGTWESSNPSVASVTSAGVVTGISGGTASFTFTVSGGAWSATTGAVTVNPSITPEVTITSDLPGNRKCETQKALIAVFTAHVSNTGGETVSYTWYYNGKPNYNLNQDKWNDTGEMVDGGTVSCMINVTGNTCLTSPTATSNTITTRVYPNVQPTVRIESNDLDNEICSKTLVTFTAIPENTNGGTVSYTWYKNGTANVNLNQSIWNDNGEAENGDVVSCSITVTNGSCFGDATATSNEIITTVNPTGGIATTTTTSLDPGKTAVLTLTDYLGSIQWQYSSGSEPVDVIAGTGSTSAVYTTPLLFEDTYFIAIVKGGTCPPVYSEPIFITVTSNCNNANDCFEPNNTLLTSLFSMPVNNKIVAKLANSKDIDWYRFDAQADAKYTLNYSNASGAILPTVDFYGSNGRKLRSIDRTQTNSFNLLMGTYYIKVSATGLKSSMCYNLMVSNQGPIVGALSTAADETKSAKIVPVSSGIIKIWPNPTNNEFELYNGNENPVQVQVMDATGRTIETIEYVGNAEAVFFGSKYKPGIYFVETCENGVQKVFKLIKQ